VIDVHVDIPVDIDVVDAGAANVVGAHVGPAVVDLRGLPLPAAAAGTGATTAASATCTRAATTATAATGSVSDGS
jgi:hypothetical protein